MHHTRLLVLDDIAVRYDLQNSLADRRDVSLQVAGSAREMVRLAASFEPDLVVFEHWMPDLLGDELLEHLRRQAGSSQLPALVTAAGIGPEATDRYRALEPVVLIEERLSVADFHRLVLEKLSLYHRRLPRVAVSLPVSMEFASRTVAGITRDLSQKGASVLADFPPSEKARVRVTIFSDENPDQELGSSSAIVHYIVDQPGEQVLVGIEFVEPPPQLVDYISYRIKEGQKLEDMLGRIERLPSLPAVTARILEESLKEDCEMGDIVSLICTDPALSAYLLKMANSVTYHFSEPVTTVRRAVSLMGLRAVRNAVLGFSILRHLSADNRSQMAYELWRHSVACALACESLAQFFNVPADEAFTMGLLHDTGKFLLLSEFVRADNGYAGRQLLARWSLERERALFGMCHAEIGAALLQRWNVPDSICQVVAHHHLGYGRELYPEYRPATELVRAADALTYSSHLGTGNGINDGMQVLHQRVPGDSLEQIRTRLFRDLSQLGEIFGQPIEPAALCAEIVERANQKLAAELEDSLARAEMLRRAYERTRQNLVSLAQAEKFHALGRVAAGVAHEINNPLSFAISNLQTLRGYLQELCADLSADGAEGNGEILTDIPQLVGETLEGLQRVSSVVQALRNFGQDTAALPEQTSLVECVREALDLLRHAIPEGVEVVVQESRLPECRLDVNAMVRVFVEVLQNAVAAMGGGGRLLVSLWVDEHWQYCSIRDSGPGMDAAQLKHVFEPFYTTQPVGQGRGLGLPVAYGIVSRHGGEILVKSQPGEGTVVTVRLPREAHDG